MAAARGDNDSTIGTLRAIDGCGILEHLQRLDVVDINVGDGVLREALEERIDRSLLVPYSAIDDEERLGVGVERVQATDEEVRAYGAIRRARHATHVSTAELR